MTNFEAEQQRKDQISDEIEKIDDLIYQGNVNPRELRAMLATFSHEAIQHFHAFELLHIYKNNTKLREKIGEYEWSINGIVLEAIYYGNTKKYYEVAKKYEMTLDELEAMLKTFATDSLYKVSTRNSRAGQNACSRIDDALYFHEKPISELKGIREELIQGIKDYYEYVLRDKRLSDFALNNRQYLGNFSFKLNKVEYTFTVKSIPYTWGINPEKDQEKHGTYLFAIYDAYENQVGRYSIKRDIIDLVDCYESREKTINKAFRKKLPEYLKAFEPFNKPYDMEAIRNGITEKETPNNETVVDEAAPVVESVENNTPDDKPTKKSRKPANKSLLTLEAINACENREEITDIFMTAKKNEILEFMKNNPSLYRQFFIHKYTKQKLASYCAYQIMEKRIFELRKAQKKGLPTEEKQATISPDYVAPVVSVNKKQQLVIDFEATEDLINEKFKNVA